MRWCLSEPTIPEMLSDPIVRALMAADRVAPEELQASLKKIARHTGVAVSGGAASALCVRISDL
jgi:hypothetical protein